MRFCINCGYNLKNEEKSCPNCNAEYKYRNTNKLSQEGCPICVLERTIFSTGHENWIGIEMNNMSADIISDYTLKLDLCDASGVIVNSTEYKCHNMKIESAGVFGFQLQPSFLPEKVKDFTTTVFEVKFTNGKVWQKKPEEKMDNDISSSKISEEQKKEKLSFVNNMDDETWEEAWKEYSNIETYTGKNRYFVDCPNFIVPKSITCIPKSFFDGCSAMKSIKMHENLSKIEGSAFCNCYNLTEISFPSSLTAIGCMAFAGCSKIQELNLSVKSIGWSAFERCIGLTKVVIHEGTKEIGASAFKGCKNLTNVSISSTVSRIGDDIFKDCEKLEKIVVDENNQYFTSIDGVLFNKDATILLIYPEGKPTDSYTVPDSVALIDKNAVKNSTILKKIKSLKNKKNVSNPNFSLIDGVLFDKKVKTLLKYPVEKRDKFYSIPEGVKEINSKAFYENSHLEKVDIPSTLKKIGEESFCNCKNLKCIFIPDTVKTIGKCAFANCENLEKAIILNGVKEIQDNAFAECTNLTEVSIPKSLQELGKDIFKHCENLKKVHVSNKIIRRVLEYELDMDNIFFETWES